MIQLEQLTKVYDLPTGTREHLLAVDQLSLEIPAGEIFGLVGPNGAGKTTTLRMIVGLLAPTSGSVRVNGIDVAAEPERAQQHIGFLSDFFALYDDLMVWEYLDYFAHAYLLDPAHVSSRVDEVLSLMGLQAKRESLIQGLSRGMKQRLGIGRAIIHNPALLILDEPTAGLDPKARSELKSLLLDLHRQGKTILITSHILSDLEEMCTQIGIMDHGCISRAGAIGQVMRNMQGARRFRLQLAAQGFDLAVHLAAQQMVSDVSSAGERFEFSFAGTDAELAELLRALVQAGAPVCGMAEIVESLEKLYSRISSNEVD